MDQHAPGAKLDQDKQLPALVLGGFAPALEDVVAVGTFGASKYSPNGWKSVENGVQRYTEALYRHLLEDLKHPGSLDKESGLPHIAHAAWNILAILTLTK